MVTGSSRFARNGFLGRGGNADLFLNMLSWLSSDEDLISIRPKDPANTPMDISQSQMSWLFFRLGSRTAARDHHCWRAHLVGASLALEGSEGLRDCAMKANPLLVAVLVLAVLGGAVYYTMENPPADDEAKPALVDVEEDQIVEVTIRKAGEDPSPSVRGEDEKWEFGGGWTCPLTIPPSG